MRLNYFYFFKNHFLCKIIFTSLVIPLLTLRKAKFEFIKIPAYVVLILHVVVVFVVAVCFDIMFSF